MKAYIKILSTILTLLWVSQVVSAQLIYPGDTNNNGIVNNIDVLYWGIAYGETGAARDSVYTNLNFSGYPAPAAWNNAFPNNLNYYYADCDGNGLVATEDLFAFYLNFGETHGIINPDVFTLGQPDDVPLTFLSTIDTTGGNGVSPGALVELSVMLGDDNYPVNNFAGIAFTLDFDTAFIRSAEVLYDESDAWLNFDNTLFFTSFPYPLFGNAAVSNNKQVATVRLGGSPISGHGAIAKTRFIIEDVVIGIIGETQKAKVAVKDIYMIDNHFNVIPVRGDSIEIPILPNASNINNPQRQVPIRVYPTVVKDNTLTIETVSGDNAIQEVRLCDFAGRIVWQQTALQQLPITTCRLPNNLTTGSYCLHIITRQGIGNKTIVILK